jgi:photoactive yellow protein
VGTEPLYPFRCAWCGASFGESAVPDSRGVCLDCLRQIRGIPDLDADGLARLPYGVLRLDRDGTILAHNPAEARIAGRTGPDVIGQNFFRDVAPCTQVKEFEGRFHEFAKRGTEPVRFSFLFSFPLNPLRVTIVFVADREEGVFVLIDDAPEPTLG